MGWESLLFAIFQHAAPAIPLPPTDSAYGLPATLHVEGKESIDRVEVHVRVDRWGRVTQARADTTIELTERGRRQVESEADELRFLPHDGPKQVWGTVVFPVIAEPPIDGEGSDDARTLVEIGIRWLEWRLKSIARRLRYFPASRAGDPVAAWHQELLAFSFDRF